MPAADEYDDDFDIEFDSYAALDFEKIADEDLLEQFAADAWTRECAQAGVTLRIAALMLRKTKPEMIKGARELGSDYVIELLDRLVAQEKRFSSLAAMLKSLQARLIVAGSAVSVAERDF